MKKISLWIALAAMVIAVAAVPVSAAYLGGGAEVLSKDVTMIKTGLIGERIVFSDTDFKEALGVSDLRSITIESLPSSTEGTLLLSGRRVAVGQTIKRKNIGAMIFIPASKNVSDCKFNFTSDGLIGGASVECTLKFIDRINYAPVIHESENDDLSVWTQSGISVYGRMSGEDPEGDECEFIVLAYPTRGTLSVTDRTSGDYRYTPSGNFTGRDEFSYVVRDEYGNYSTPCTVKIRVENRRANITYVDMIDAPAYNAAVVMNAMGVMSGKLIGDGMYFLPDETVSRAEFVAMALKTCGIRADSTLSSTFFDDNGQIPVALVGYVATAQKLGIVSGAFDGAALNFRPNDPITVEEAAIVISRLLGTEENSEASSAVNLGTNVPVWARSSVSAMYQLGIFDKSQDTASLNRPLTRADAATFLWRMCSHI